MSRSWNGESLVNEFSQLLGDTSTVFKARVLGWINDTTFDISSRYDWGHFSVKGKKILALDTETHSLEISAPIAPEVELANDGDFEPGSTVSVLVTFVQGNGVESVAGEASEVLTITESQRTISISDIPTSPESLVTKRNIYLKVNDGDYYFHTQIDDNISTTQTISTLTDSLIEPPDYEAIRRIDGSPFFEEGAANRLIYRSNDQLRMLIEGSWTLGQPEYFYPVKDNSISVYPIPSLDTEVSFNYFRNPFKTYNSADSSIDLPVNLKPVLKAGVIALGYEYRDRQGQEGKRATYEELLRDSISRMGKSANVEFVIRDVYGNFNGNEVG